MRGRYSCRRIMLSAVILWQVAVGAAAAQGTTATFLGTVKDETGGALAGVTVEVRNSDTGLTRMVTTDSEGRYRTPDLSPGNYAVQAALEGFETVIRTGIQLTVGREALVDFTLKVGMVTQQVVVTGEAPLVNTTNAALGHLVDDKEIRALPLNGRSYEQLALLEPGVARFSHASANVSTRVLNGAGQAMSIAGTPTDFTSFLLDGTNVADQANFTPGSVARNNLGVDSILEFRVLTQNYSAQYGRTAGGVISAVSRGGTNELHGTGFEFFRSDALDARQFFDQGGPKPFRRNQFGFALGGPLARNRTFFFVNYEGLRERLTVTRVSTVPSADARRGLIPTPGGTVVVPVSPAVLPYLDLFPLPNGRDFGDGTAQLTWALEEPTTEHYVSGRLDHQFSDRLGFFARATVDRADAVSGRPTPGFLTTARSRNVFITLEQKMILSPRLLNVARVAFNRTNPSSLSASTDARAAALAFVPGQDFGSLRFSGSPFGTTGGLLSELGNSGISPARLTQNVFQYSDDLNWQRGRHALRAGVDAQRVQSNNVQNFALGTYTFADLAGFLAARPTLFFTQTPDPGSGFRQWIVGMYVQDDFRWSDRLTLNLGLRYERVTIPSEVGGRQANILDVRQDAGPTMGAIFLENPSTWNFGPRVGFAWDPRGARTTVVRGGFGVYHNELMGRLIYSNARSGIIKSAAIPAAPFPNPGLERAIESLPLTSQRFFTIDPYAKTPTVYHFNLTIERQLWAGLVASATYAGSHGLHLGRQIEANTRVPKFLPDGTPVYAGGPRLNPLLGSVSRVMTDAISNYHALQLRVGKRLSARWQFQGNYTLSKAMSENTAYQAPQTANTPDSSLIPFDRHADRSLSSYDVHQMLNVTFTVRLPGDALTGVAGALLKGWEVGGILAAYAGLPVTIGLPLNQSGDGNGLVPDRPNLRADQSNNPVLGRPGRWYDPTAFELPPPGRYGNLGRNTVTGPGMVTVDGSLVKTTAVGGGRTLAFRAEFFNLLNRANFGLPQRIAFTSTGAVAGNAGVIQSLTTPGRQIQLGVRYAF